MSHLDTMQKALNVSNYKLQLMPPDDSLVDEKSFASRFTQDALSELSGVSNEIELELLEIEEVFVSSSCDSNFSESN